MHASIRGAKGWVYVLCGITAVLTVLERGGGRSIHRRHLSPGSGGLTGTPAHA